MWSCIGDKTQSILVASHLHKEIWLITARVYNYSRPKFVLTSVWVIPIAFVTAIHGRGEEPEINVANAATNCTVYPGHDLLDCPQIGEDISICQQRYSKTILLSVGGVTYSEGGFQTASQATYGADLLWATFGPQNQASQALRPFGTAVIDGFDLDFERKVDNVLPFAARLRALMDADRERTSKQWLLTIAPQCPYPDQANNALLNNEIYFDAVWVQYYNNKCGLQSFDSVSSTQDTFNFDTWDTWARHNSRNPSVKILLGIPGAPGAATSGYQSTNELRSIFEYCKQFSSFGGIMVWDASQAYTNSNFLPDIKTELLNLDTVTINGC